MERFISLRNLSMDNAYDEERIKERILQNTIVKMESVQKPVVMKYKYKGSLNKKYMLYLKRSYDTWIKLQKKQRFFAVIVLTRWMT